MSNDTARPPEGSRASGAPGHHHDNPSAALDLGIVLSYFKIIHGDLPGFVSLGSPDAAGKFGRWTTFATSELDGATGHVATLDVESPSGIFARVTTLWRPPTHYWERGGEQDSCALPGLWCDIDFAGPGHKTDESLPPDDDAARAILRVAGLPDPTLWIDTGGGRHGYWLFDEPYLLPEDQDERRAEVGELQALSKRLQGLIFAAAQQLGGWHTDRAVYDLARVLRIPGTVNRKEGLRRQCGIVDKSRKLALVDLAACIMDNADRLVPAPACATAARTSTRREGVLRPGDDYNQRAQWRELLPQYGWTFVYTRAVVDGWRRPGKERGSISATTNFAGLDLLVVHSDAAPVPKGTYDKFGFYAAMHHGGNISAAASALRAENYGGERPSGQDAAFRELLPNAEPATRPVTAQPATPPGGLQPAHTPQATEPALRFARIAELCERVDAAGRRLWLIHGIWPAGDYGVHAAEMKAQKTWNTVDLAVSVASGTPWLGAFEIEATGPVLMFAGEGGEADLVRRIRAVCAARELKAEDLDLVICARAPHLSNAVHVAEMSAAIGDVRPRLVTVDPFYLAAPGANTAQLTEMGRLLEVPQRLCQAAGAALFVVTHHNRKEGRGAARISGAGPAEWGRVLITAAVLSRHTDPASGQTTVVTELDVIGGSVPDRTIRIMRRIRAEVPDDLDSILSYTVGITDAAPADAPSADADGKPMPPARRKLWEALRAIARPSTQRELVDWIAEHYGHGLKRETASRELNTLRRTGLADAIDEPGHESMWFAVEGCDQA